MGCKVSVVDNDWGNCGTLFNSDYVARKMGWDLKAFDRDVARRLPFASGSIDRVFSICTIEHLTSDVRRLMMAEVGRVLKPGGIAAITMCYDPNHTVLTVDRGLRFGYRAKFDADVILPSGLRIYGNTDLLDWRQERGFLGAIFLEKPA
jgi:SAM-dependent methyltransferase